MVLLLLVILFLNWFFLFDFGFVFLCWEGIRKFNKVALFLLSLIMDVFVGVCGVVYLVFPYLN
jgi:hypothetical protein